jgi:hypothetical protein
MSSSPALPSPRELLKKKPAVLRTGSRAAPIPANISISFTTASSLLRKPLQDETNTAKIRTILSGFEENIDHDSHDSKPPKRSRKTATRKNIGLKDDNVAIGNSEVDGSIADNVEPKKPKKPRKTKYQGELGTENGVKEKMSGKPKAKDDGGVDQKGKPARKPRLKKADGDTQTRLPTAQVTKSTTKPDKAESTKKAKKPALVSKHFPTTLEPETVQDPLGYGLAEAIKRRSTWTPPKATPETAPVTTPAPVDFVDSGVGFALPKTSDESKGFTDLFGSYGFNDSESKKIEKKISGGALTRKRKLVELVTTSISTSKGEAPSEACKAKGTKKKARTITGLATSAYSPDEELPAQPAPLLQYFSYQTTDRVMDNGNQKSSKPRSKSPVKRALRLGSGTAQAPILLSPESALKQVGTQDFVFGTSSQLAREESPTLLRDLHAAMQASNEIESDEPFADSITDSTISFKRASQGKLVPSLKRNLWSAANRSTSGGLLDIEVVDLANSPAYSQQVQLPIEVASIISSEALEDDGIWHDIEESVLQKDSPASKQLKSLPAFERRNEMFLDRPSSSLSSNVSSLKAVELSIPSETLPAASQPAVKAAKSNTQMSKGKKPDFASYTMAQLAKEIASYRFKPIKKREEMIFLLEKCWEGKQRLALGTSYPPNKPVESSLKPAKVSEVSSSQNGAPPERPRGRPRKCSLGSSSPKPKTKTKTTKSKYTNTVENLELDSDTPLSQVRTPRKMQKESQKPAEDISDSDFPSKPSPPRRRPSQIKASQLPISVPESDAVQDGADLSPTSTQKEIFKHITHAVTSTSPSKDPRNPTWHEKILLYDPIILEDLAAWLNTGALEKAGWDGEVHPWLVKKWCESKSVCCLWKENLRGGPRSRY